MRVLSSLALFALHVHTSICGCKWLDQRPRLLLVHALGGEGQAHGHGGQEALRHVGHDDPDHEHQVGDERGADHEAEDEEDDTQDDGDRRDDLLGENDDDQDHDDAETSQHTRESKEAHN